MSDNFWGKIEIGGKLSRKDLPRFFEAAGIGEQEVIESAEEGTFVREDDAARYGEFDGLESLCQELGLPYIRWSEGKYEFSPEVSFWIPGMSGPDTSITDNSNNIVVDVRVVKEIRDALRENRDVDALEIAEKNFVELPVLPPFQIVD